VTELAQMRLRPPAWFGDQCDIAEGMMLEGTGEFGVEIQPADGRFDALVSQARGGLPLDPTGDVQHGHPAILFAHRGPALSDNLISIAGQRAEFWFDAEG